MRSVSHHRCHGGIRRQQRLRLVELVQSNARMIEAIAAHEAADAVHEGDDSTLEQLFKRLANKGLLEIDTDARTLTLRRPAERLINMARRMHQQIQSDATPETEDITDA